ncbi:penicillin acylase family protein [Nitrosospira lacus]|uniref:Penicillin acylase family protein n=1 Tax=Nitrosospira lacus TaxID=1288494 RepID=A0A1W6SS81_9PROT|nr:penicillin acylase family protein [Nitrosospira lacus]ARO88625.1 penicillin acylase family protein [Nitrosospira lacus]
MHQARPAAAQPFYSSHMTAALRPIYRLLLGLLILVLLLIGSAWLVLRGSLPQYDGTMGMTALAAPVIVERDALGSVTLQAQNRHDLIRALGYVHAQERFFEMDLMRRKAAGELAELFGPVALPADRKVRMHRMRARASAILEELPAKQRELLDVYRDGVNEGLAALMVRPFPYLLTRTRPLAWRSEDSILVVKAMYFMLNGGDNHRELAFSTMRAALPEAAYRFLTAGGGAWDAPLIGTAFDWPRLPSASELDLHKLEPGLVRDTEEHSDNLPGSNSFAVAGSLAAGAALVANDMHLDLRVPNIWFRTRLIYPDPRQTGLMNDIAGASLPGTPAIAVGSNRKIAWSFTNSYGDSADWIRVILHPEDATRYRSAKGWSSITIHREILHVRGGQDETLDVHETEWGPVLATDHDGTPLALAWAAHRAGAVNMELTLLEQAETVNEAIAIAQNAGIPAQNFIVGDRDGRIGWTIAGRIPARTSGYDPTLPADWSKPDTGWNGWLMPAQYPLIVDPPERRLWTANARAVDGLLLDRIGDGGYDLGARAMQIRDRLREYERFSPPGMLAIQLDDRALFLARWKEFLELTLKRMEPAPWRVEMQHALLDWNGHASTDSVAYRVVRAFRQEVTKSVLGGFATAIRRIDPNFELPKLNQAEHAVWRLIEHRPQHLLPPVYADWDELFVSCAERVAKHMQSQPGGIAERSWGERNTARIRHPLSRALPEFVANWLDMRKDALPGDIHMPRVQAPDFGASQRFAVAPGDEEHGYFEMPGGQSGHPLSPYYGSGHTDWVAGKPTPFLPGPARQTLHLRPVAHPVARTP